jgi:hypothetical protein
MKKSSEHSESVRQHLNRFAIAVIVAAVGLLALAWPAEAKVVYTPVNVTISGNGSIRLDLNHDGITDFVIHSESHITACGYLRAGLMGSTKITPKTGSGVVVSQLNFAELFASGIAIGAGADFYKAQAVVTQFVVCSGGHTADGYLGLEFQINGQTHYGWAQVQIFAYYSHRGNFMRTTLVGFAYETIPGQAIKTGQTSGAAEGLDSANPED